MQEKKKKKKKNPKIPPASTTTCAAVEQIKTKIYIITVNQNLINISMDLSNIPLIKYNNITGF